MEQAKKFLERVQNEYQPQDLHITRMFSSFVAISDREVIDLTDPYLKYCPLANMLYEDMKKEELPLAEIKETIKKTVREKIEKFGHFTSEREIIRNDIAVPYGASEMMSFALRKDIIDAAVVACDGAGTVITDRADVVQGIGARMNGLFYTSPIQQIIEDLEKYDSIVVFPETAAIKQIEGLKQALKMGHKKIAVTINGYSDEKLSRVAALREKYKEAEITAIIVCNTGISTERVKEITKYADLVWSCASQEIREITGEKAILQLSLAIPVFVLTQTGLNFTAAYVENENVIRNLDPDKQYLVAGNHKGQKINIGNFQSYLSQKELPIRSDKEPK